jgi:alkanesulfonate monooxygenase SsuD/methylene tetrahydromethanopterin reductase-like flavin-dependent oxidoreductase (luciferase family)
LDRGEMKFFLSGLGNMYANLDHIKEAVIEADGLGFDGALMPDHYMWGQMGGGHMFPDPYSTLETWVTLTYLAGKTERIGLGTLVTPVPFRPPAQLAKMLSTLDVLSGGRVIFGVGAGWSQVEFEGYSEWGSPKNRVDRTEEGVRLILRLWTEDEVDHEGRYYTAKGAVLKPKPVQKPHPPLLFAGPGKRMLSMAGRYGDLVYIPMWTQGSPQEARARVMRAAEKAGRADKVSFIAGDMGGRGPYDLAEHLKKVEAAEESGAKVYMTGFPREGYFEAMRKFAGEVMSSYR